MELLTARAAPTIIPHLWYRNQEAALDLLQRAFGFTLHFSAAEPGGGVHAELRVGCGFVMVGPAHAARFGVRTPREIGNVNTGACYVATPEVEALYRRAKAAGVSILSEPSTTDWDSLDFSARDHEGYLWHFGTYHPTAGGVSSHDTAAHEAEVSVAVRYENAPAAIAWLTSVFGLKQERRIDSEGRVAHALLSFGPSLLIASSTRDDDPLKMRSPVQIGGARTQTIYVVVDAPDAHCEHARHAGAEILMPPTDMPWGARLYMTRDLEGYAWCFSTYGPKV